jgi:hypothetical protein
MLSRVTTVLSAVCALAMVMLLIFAASAMATTRDVWPGQSIQAAINKAKPGDTVLVHRGAYHQAVMIAKNGINLVGRDVTLLPPKHSRGLCFRFTGSGICVLGKLDQNGNSLPGRARNNSVSGFRVEHFSGEGIFLDNVANTRVVGNVAAFNGDYGIVGFDQRSGSYLWNVSHDNAAPGFYLGDSPHAGYVIAHNVSFRNQFGIFVRHSAHGVIADNRVWGNCVGVLFLDDGQPGGEHDLALLHNRSWANDKACAANDDGPGLSGIGVLFVGVRDSVAARNVIRNNAPSGPSLFSGGLLLVSAAPIDGGNDPMNDRIVHNTLLGNSRVDVLWDQTGSGNVFAHNTCGTANPASIC